MAEEKTTTTTTTTDKVAAKPEPTHEYKLKAGFDHTAIVDGEIQSLSGSQDGSVTVKLTEDQAKAFSDKFELADPAAQNMKNTTTMIVGHDTGGAPTIPEGAARAGQAAGIEPSNAKENPPPVTNLDDPTRPQGALDTTMDASKAGLQKNEVEGKGSGGVNSSPGSAQAGSTPAGAAVNASHPVEK